MQAGGFPEGFHRGVSRSRRRPREAGEGRLGGGRGALPDGVAVNALPPRPWACEVLPRPPGPQGGEPGQEGSSGGCAEGPALARRETSGAVSLALPLSPRPRSAALLRSCERRAVRRRRRARPSQGLGFSGFCCFGSEAPPLRGRGFGARPGSGEIPESRGVALPTAGRRRPGRGREGRRRGAGAACSCASGQALR